VKLCWDNLNELRYNKKTGKWYKDRYKNGMKVGTTPYLLNEKGCLSCQEPFFYCLGNKGTCCTWSCNVKYKNSIYGISKETAIKIGKGNKGKKRTDKQKAQMKYRPQCQISGDNNPMKRKEIRLKNTGKNHWNWQGGITGWREELRNKIEYKQWRISVFQRDNYICQECGIRGGKLHAHHIKLVSKFPELILDINNGITICKKCHTPMRGKEHLFEKKYLQLIQNMLSYNKNHN